MLAEYIFAGCSIQHETHEYNRCMIQINKRIYQSSVCVLHFHLLAPAGLV